MELSIIEIISEDSSINRGDLLKIQSQIALFMYKDSVDCVGIKVIINPNFTNYQHIK